MSRRELKHPPPPMELAAGDICQQKLNPTKTASYHQCISIKLENVTIGPLDELLVERFVWGITSLVIPCTLLTLMAIFAAVYFLHSSNSFQMTYKINIGHILNVDYNLSRKPPVGRRGQTGAGNVVAPPQYDQFP